MAWDSKTARRRQNSIAEGHIVQNVSEEAQKIQPKSAHVSDPALQPFLDPSFDPTQYLNATLPSLKTPNPSQSTNASVPLAELSTQTQTLLSQLSAHTTRLTTTLTQLTDEILKSGSRLAYEVEVLRGETLGLSETLIEGLRDDVEHFVPGGLESTLAKKPVKSVDTNVTSRRRSSTLLTPRTPMTPKSPFKEDVPIDKPAEPPYIEKLRTLTLVRERLDTVVKIFGDAMEWTFPPSEVSVSSSFLSVSAPEPGSDMNSTEEKGKQVSKKLKDEVADLLMGEDPVEGIEAAAKKVEELKELAMVWKGTAEEKARMRFVESLAKMVEDRHRDLLREAEQSNQSPKLSSEALPASSGGDRITGGYGFISQLQKLRGGS